MKKQLGFTLIELMVAMMIVISSGFVVASILYSSLRGSNKTNVITKASQSGQSTIEQISKMVRNAKSLDNPASCVLPPAGSPTPTPPSSITITSFDGGWTTFECCLNANPATIASRSAGADCVSGSLIDTDFVSLRSCRFTCTQESALDVPVIGIDFTLAPVVDPGVTLPPEKITSEVPFHTSVWMRNLKK